MAVLRPGARPTAAELVDLIATLAEAVARSDVAGHLWIVEVGRIRAYSPAPELNE